NLPGATTISSIFDTLAHAIAEQIAVATRYSVSRAAIGGLRSSSAMASVWKSMTALWATGFSTTSLAALGGFTKLGLFFSATLLLHASSAGATGGDRWCSATPAGYADRYLPDGRDRAPVWHPHRSASTTGGRR